MTVRYHADGEGKRGPWAIVRPWIAACFLLALATLSPAPIAAQQLAAVAAPVAPAPSTSTAITPTAITPASTTPASATPAPTTADMRRGMPPEYRIIAGDELDIFVWGEERMQRTVRVLPDGTFAFPLAGTIAAADKTVNDVARDIRDKISPNFRADIPDVTVTVRDMAGLRFYVVGKVKTPGGYAAGRAVDVLQALSLAGGLAEFADVKNAVILRQTAGGQIVEPVRLAKVLKGRRKLEPGALAEPLPLLRSGDVLVIP